MQYVIYPVHPYVMHQGEIAGGSFSYENKLSYFITFCVSEEDDRSKIPSNFYYQEFVKVDPGGTANSDNYIIANKTESILYFYIKFGV